MKNHSLRLSFCLLLLPFPALSSTPHSAFDRYSVILTRMPFGDESSAAPLATSATVVTPPPLESFTKNLKMCAITRNHFDGKIQIGIVNMITRKSYFLHEGASEDGMELVRADFDNEKALLKKNTEAVWMDMTSATAATPVVTFGPHGMQIIPPSPVAQPVLSTGVNDNSTGNADNRAGSSSSRSLDAEFQLKMGQPQVERTISRESSEMIPPPTPVGAGGFGRVNNSSVVASTAKGQTATASSAALALNQSMASALEVAALIPPPDPIPAQVAATPGSASVNNDVMVMDYTQEVPQLTAAYLQKQLQDYQMELIRAQGAKGPPLPIVLTPSMDAQLVSEGVLPPSAQ